MWTFSGVKILFRVALVLLRCTLGSQENLKSCQGLYETMQVLRAIPPKYMGESFLVQEVNTCVVICLFMALFCSLSPFLLDFALL